MHAMVFSKAPGAPLTMQERPDPLPGPDHVRVKSACGVCRTDLHVVDGDCLNRLSDRARPRNRRSRRRARARRERSARSASGSAFPGWADVRALPLLPARPGKSLRPPAIHRLHPRRRIRHASRRRRPLGFPLGEAGDDVALAPLLCAGLIGWRSLVMAGEAEHRPLRLRRRRPHHRAGRAWQGRAVYAFTRAGDDEAQAARSLGADWAGGSEERRPSRSTPQSSSRRSARWCRWRCAPCARAAASSAPAST